MTPRACHGAIAAAFLLVLAGPAQSQRANARGVGPTAAADSINPNVSVVAIHLPIDAVRGETARRRAEKPQSRKRGLLGALEQTIKGDDSEIDAAKHVLGQMAQSFGADGNTTVIVVIGDEDQRDKVVESLHGVARKVVVAWVDDAHADAASDNTVLTGGLAGAITDAATNLWVYLPHSGESTRDKPDHTLSTTLASATLWNGYFAADGDALDLDQLGSLVASDDDDSDETDARSMDGAAQSSNVASPAVGDVVTPKISGAPILTDAAEDARVAGKAARSDEFVVTGPARNGYLPVEGAELRGWIRAALVTTTSAR